MQTAGAVVRQDPGMPESLSSRPWPVLSILLAVSAASSAVAQDVASRWEAAGRKVGDWSRALDRAPRPRWTDDGTAVWFSTRADGERVYLRVDRASGKQTVALDAASIGITEDEGRLPALSRRSRSGRNRGERVEVRFRNELDEPVVLRWVAGGGESREYARVADGETHTQGTFAGHLWHVESTDGELRAVFRAGEHGGLAVIDAAAVEALDARPRPRRGRGGDGPERTSGPAPAFLRDGVLWRRGADGPSELAESRDGQFRRDLHVSPDGRRALAFDETVVEQRQLTLVASSPRDQLQPETRTVTYVKPGDPLPQVRPRLFDLGVDGEIDVDAAPFRDAYSIRNVHWAPDGSEVHLLYNRRGHQQLTVYAIDATSGAVRPVVDERSETFVDYSQKTWMHWLDDRGELLWASERSGYNHLYRVDVASGELQAITSGAWMVRAVERVDEERGQIWFTALGIHPDQDPYHRHLARVDFDGSNLVVLTEADGDHTWEFAPDREHFIARWSRIDQPTVVELRRSGDGGLVAELVRDDPSQLLDQGFAYAERFVAPGRDGETPIHGYIVRPSDFDPARRYPVLESIYAGPHDFHVPKSFTVDAGTRRFAEMGFVVVRIDGMGTNWRGKAFHDVCWHNLRDAGFPDRIAWMKAAAADRPWMDLERVGVFGGSAGGQNAMAALLWHGDFYKAAAADCGCHDNRMDKIWWNEAWMGWPVGPWYAANSNVEHAHQLQGDLFLTVGELDTNVDPASTLQVVDALIRADKDFEFLLIPGGGHGAGGGRYGARRRIEFFVRSLRP